MTRLGLYSDLTEPVGPQATHVDKPLTSDSHALPGNTRHQGVSRRAEERVVSFEVCHDGPRRPTPHSGLCVDQFL